MNKNRIFKEKGITLIALVVTIVVLLILAGVSIAVLTGENGIINRTTEAKKTTEEAEVIEKIRLAFLNAQIGRYAGEHSPTDYATFASTMQAELVKTLGTGATVTSNGTGFLVTYGDMKFDVSNTGAVERKSGVIITQKVEKIKNGSTAPVTATLDGITGTISWESSNSEVVAVTGSGTSATIEGKASSGYATITAYIAGTEHEDSFRVDIAQTATGITANPATAQIAKNGTVQMGVDVTPTGVVEDLTYTYLSSNTNVATVNENGLVTGVASGTATITITAVENTNLTTQCTVTVTKVAVTSVQIKDVSGTTQTVTEADLSNWYGKKVDYTTGGTYRIFYIDFDGKYGEPGTIYLKADYESSRKIDLNSYASFNAETTLVREMNPSWASGATSSTDTVKRGAKPTNNWNMNEQAAAYLCTPTCSASGEFWSAYYDETKADYVIGSPSVEMYCDSYNQVTHTIGTYILGATYRATAYPGYIFTLGNPPAQSTVSNSEYWTGYNTLDNSGYKYMYCPIGDNYWWLASPSSDGNSNYGYVCSVNGTNAFLAGRWSGTRGLCPIVSLKFSFIPQVQAET